MIIPSDKFLFIQKLGTEKVTHRIPLTISMISFLDAGKYDTLYMYCDNTYLYLRKKPKEDLDLSNYKMVKEVSITVDTRRGRVTIPKPIIDEYGIYEGQKLAIRYIEDGRVIAFKSFQNHCNICKSTNDLLVFSGVYLCRDCHSKFT